MENPKITCCYQAITLIEDWVAAAGSMSVMAILRQLSFGRPFIDAPSHRASHCPICDDRPSLISRRRRISPINWSSRFEFCSTAVCAARFSPAFFVRLLSSNSPAGSGSIPSPQGAERRQISNDPAHPDRSNARKVTSFLL
jgi:hypothetical protein